MMNTKAKPAKRGNASRTNVKEPEAMKILLKNAALALTLPGMLAVALPANAAVSSHAAIAAHAGSVAAVYDHDNEDGDRWEHGRGHDNGRHRGWERQGRGGYQGSYGGGYGGGSYYGERAYARPQYEPVYQDTRIWRGNNGNNYCQRRDGTTGLLIGGAAGALLGREVAGRYGDRTLGAILGAAGGAILGRSIDRSSARCQ